jgi:hypothetical protein
LRRLLKVKITNLLAIHFSANGKYVATLAVELTSKNVTKPVSKKPAVK